MFIHSQLCHKDNNHFWTDRNLGDIFFWGGGLGKGRGQRKLSQTIGTQIEFCPFVDIPCPIFWFFHLTLPHHPSISPPKINQPSLTPKTLTYVVCYYSSSCLAPNLKDSLPNQTILLWPLTSNPSQLTLTLNTKLNILPHPQPLTHKQYMQLFSRHSKPKLTSVTLLHPSFTTWHLISTSPIYISCPTIIPINRPFFTKTVVALSMYGLVIGPLCHVSM